MHLYHAILLIFLIYLLYMSGIIFWTIYNIFKPTASRLGEAPPIDLNTIEKIAALVCELDENQICQPVKASQVAALLADKEQVTEEKRAILAMVVKLFHQEKL